MKKALSFDIGGTKINFAIIDENGNVINDIQKNIKIKNNFI